MRDILRRDDGITIVFAVLLVILLLVMGGVIVSYGYSGYKRSVADNSDERNYQNVASATRLVRDEVVAEKKTQDDELKDTKGDANLRVSAKGWVSDLLSRSFNNKTEGHIETTALKVTPQSTNDSGEPSFADVTIAVRKVSDGSYDMVCYETGNSAGTSMHFSVGYSEPTHELTTKEKVTVRRIGTIGEISKVGQ